MTRVAKNDPSLAHGLADRTLREHAAKLDARAAGMSMQVKDGGGALKLARKLWRGHIAHEVITKPHGARARWYLVLVDVYPENVTIAVTGWKGGQMLPARILAVIEMHALARMVQRTLGRADLAAIVDKLRRFVPALAELAMADELVEGRALDLIGAGGALLGTCGEGYAKFGTWVDGDSAADPDIRRHAFNTGTIHSRLR